eukprot:NODE_563_length_6640_cov_0.236661.p2 type:complete len:329 gc:universal NODE_563_length_6640_cov_0.236661:1104-118(-)
MKPEIKLDKGAYNPGEIIQGTCFLKSNRKYKDITLNFKGKERTRWAERHGDNTRTYSEHAVIFTVTHSLMQELSPGLNNTSGYFEYPFQIQIPMCASSFKGSYGKIYYTLTLRCHKSFLDDKTKLPIIIRPFGCIPSESISPIVQQHQKSFSTLINGGGMMEILVKANSQGYKIGDLVQVSINFQNNSKKKISSITVKLLQNTEYRAKKKGKLSSANMFKEKKEINYEPGQSGESQFSFNIPMNVLPSSKGRLISNEYEIEIQIKYEGLSTSTVINMPVLIGTHVGPAPNVQFPEIITNGAIAPAHIPENNTVNVEMIKADNPIIQRL